MNWIIDRLKEPSTYKGLATLLALAGVVVSPELQAAIALAGPAIAAAVLGCVGVYNVIKKG